MPIRSYTCPTHGPADHLIAGEYPPEAPCPACQQPAAYTLGAPGPGIVTGSATGKPVDAAELAAARAASPLPVLVGSGATPSSLPALFAHAHAVIVGSSIKQDGLWSNELCPDRMRAIVAARNAIR